MSGVGSGISPLRAGRKILEDVKSYWSGRRLAFYKTAALNGVTDSVKDVEKR